MYHLREMFPTGCLFTFYKTMAKPIKTQGLVVYGDTAKTNLEMVKKTQRRILNVKKYLRKTMRFSTKYVRKKE